LPTHEPRLQTVGLRPDDRERSVGAPISPDDAEAAASAENPASKGESRTQHALH